MYFSMTEELSNLDSTFCFRPNGRSFGFNDVPVGIYTLKNVVPKFMKKAGLPGKTAHSLRVTCASTLFNKGFDQKLVKHRTGHNSDAVFGYEKISKEIMANVSDALNLALQSYSFHKRELEVQDEKGKEVEGKNKGGEFVLRFRLCSFQ